ncbi:AAA family ATPase [Microscilla marina]|uniref:ATP-binding protein n=1 Tax=Microscilla marina ATCC 23134 TaxID=313606 RepID=A1ZG26_MICM2|nr:AAA family ATPase [Microscilla marina]EAY30443.1 ATP-binding protein [Microscilla marina ATCC 23134]
MKIKELELNNFRGFKHLKIQFPDNNLAVFIGTNGSGKSSVLDALGMASLWFLRLAKWNESDQYFFDRFLLKGFNLINQDIRINSDEALQVKLTGQQANGIRISKFTNQEISIGSFNLKKTSIVNANGSLPIVAYYQTEKHHFLRRTNQKHEIEEGEVNDNNPIKKILPQLATYQNAFSSKISHAEDFSEWFKQIEDEEVRQIRNKSDFSYRDFRLEVVRKALDVFFSALGSDKYTNLSVKVNDSPVFEFKASDYSLAINKNGQDFDINQLSDGEKTLIMLVCDIARRLTIANPALENKLEGEGVVMIDEIELHLHPAWQRNVLPALQQTFPNIQFIVTTHSPHVLNNVDARNIFLFRNENNQITCEQPDSTLGRDVNWILEEVMGVSARPREFEPKLTKVQKLIEEGGKENLSKARDYIEQLFQDFNLTHDRELNAKLAVIKRKEVLGR